MSLTSSHLRRRVGSAAVAHEPPRGDIGLNPWRFARVRIPPELKREFSGLELPRIPTERLYSGATTRARARRGARTLPLALAVVAAMALVVAVIWWGTH